MLLCGYENFDKYFVRIDILERLFMQIINTNPDGKTKIKLVPEMLNLLGCNKDNFKKLLKIMGYKVFEKNNDIFFKYNPRKSSKKVSEKFVKESPFKVLKNLNLNQ